MKRLYDKNAFGFSLLWIGVYVVGLSLADGISSAVGVEKIITAPLSTCMTVYLLIWLGRNGLLGTYGLKKKRISGRPYLWFLPLVIMASTNLWGGVALQYSLPETALYVVSMIGVGILEEVIFRGFLFKALCRENVKWAVVVSSLTFGIGHVVNLLNGADLLPTLLQICYATAAGFLFTVIFLRSGNLLPCIVTHSVINSLSVFGAERSPLLDILAAAALTGLSLLYALWIIKATNKPQTH